MKTDTKMAWRNVWRNPRRSLLTIMAIGFASLLLVFMLSFQLGSYSAMVNNAVLVQTGHLQVQAQAFKDKNEMRRVVHDPDQIVQIMADLPRVKAVTTRAEAFALLSSEDRTYGGVVVGIDPDSEARVTRVRSMLREGTYLRPGNHNGAMVGSLLAKNLKLGLGDELVVLGQDRQGGFAAAVMQVTGIFSAGQDAFDRATVMVSLPYFQEAFAMEDSVHQVVAVADGPRELEPMAGQLRQALSGLENGRYPLVAYTWMDLLPGLLQSIQMDLVGGLIFYVILVVVVAFSILNTFLMSVFERMHEFGVLLAVGMTPGRLGKLLYTESIMITVLGILAGWIGGFALSLYFQSNGIPLSSDAAKVVAEFGIPERLYPMINGYSLTVGPVLVLVVTLLTALYPVFRVRKLLPIQGLRA